MNAEQLSRVGEKLVKRCGSRDPFEIARQLGINVMRCENFGSLKGMYRVIKRNRFIFLNNSLDENMLRIVCAHELVHIAKRNGRFGGAERSRCGANGRISSCIS